MNKPVIRAHEEAKENPDSEGGNSLSLSKIASLAVNYFSNLIGSKPIPQSNVTEIKKRKR